MPTTENSFTVQRISARVWKVPAEGNAYFLDFERKIIIDTSSRAERPKLEMFLSKVVDFSKITDVVLTHLHLDHCANIDLFPNAKLWASRAEIEQFRKDPNGTVLDPRLAEKVATRGLHPAEDAQLPELEIIHTPGHTVGSICLFCASEKILFSGDTIFPVGIGRTDLPSSIPSKMQDSLNKLAQYNFKILCAGHDYGLH